MTYVNGGAAAARRTISAVRTAALGLFFAAGVCGTAFAQSAPSQPNATPAAGATDKPKADNPGDKVICHYEDGDTGSRLNGRTKVCHTKREWDQINKEASDYINTNGRCPARPK